MSFIALSGNIGTLVILFNVINLVPEQYRGRWLTFLAVIAFLIMVAVMFNMAWLTNRHWRLMLTQEGVLVAGGFLELVVMSVSDIKVITVPKGKYHGLSWSNWEESGGEILIEHGSGKTTIKRFPEDEDFLMNVTSRNPNIKVVRIDAD